MFLFDTDIEYLHLEILLTFVGSRYETTNVLVKQVKQMLPSFFVMAFNKKMKHFEFIVLFQIIKCRHASADPDQSDPSPRTESG